MNNRIGNWMQTYSGRQYWPLDPSVDDVYIEDIAHALSMMCRYSGHCLNFYSVAEHSCHMFDHATRPNKKWALLHDGSEAYITDIIRPIKPYLTNYKELEQKNMAIICQKFGIPQDMPAEVNMLDNAILHSEKLQNMAIGPEWNLPPKRIDVTLQFWEPKRAEKEFLTRFNEVIND